MSLNLRTVMNHKKNVNEIVAASGLVYNNGKNDIKELMLILKVII